MEAKAKLLGHPIHQMLVVFPLGLFGGAAVFDVLYQFTGKQAWAVTAYWALAAGLVTALPTAFFGFVDWNAIPKNTRAKRVGLAHGIGNIIAIYLFAQSLVSRLGRADAPLAFSTVVLVLGFVITGVTGWLGGELVDRMAIGVDPGAHPDAPSSLKVGKLSL